MRAEVVREFKHSDPGQIYPTVHKVDEVLVAGEIALDGAVEVSAGCIENAVENGWARPLGKAPRARRKAKKAKTSAKD